MTYLKNLSLRHFRNYRAADFEFSPKINFLIGKNGQGKTNCLEAVALFISGKSFRSHPLKDLIYDSKEEFFLKTEFIKNGVEQSISFNYSDFGKTIYHNESKYTSFLPLVGVIQGVLFAGFYSTLIKSSPQVRRKFLDLQNVQIDPLYLKHLSHFFKALKERNVCLKRSLTKPLSIYEELMSQSIPYLISKRLENLKSIERLTQKIHQTLSDETHAPHLLYKTPFEADFEKCLELLQTHRSKDLKVGYTQLGPHKDEIEILLGNKSAKKFASEGQVQTLTTAIYLSEYKRIVTRTNDSPIFCLDDLGQNLDQARLERLMKYLEKMGQVFITSPQMPPFEIECEHKIFEIENGALKSLCT